MKKVNLIDQKNELDLKLLRSTLKAHSEKNKALAIEQAVRESTTLTKEFRQQLQALIEERHKGMMKTLRSEVNQKAAFLIREHLSVPELVGDQCVHAKLPSYIAEFNRTTSAEFAALKLKLKTQDAELTEAKKLAAANQREIETIRGLVSELKGTALAHGA